MILESVAVQAPTELVGQDPYQAFKEAGGSLTKNDFKVVSALRLKMANKPALIGNVVNKTESEETAASFHSQEMICEKLGIKTSEEQKALYCFLRYRRASNHRPIIRAHGLSDQEIVADILLMTGRTTDQYIQYLGYCPAVARRRFPQTLKLDPSLDHEKFAAEFAKMVKFSGFAT